MELKPIEATVKSFTANGTEYFVEYSLSIARYKAYLKLQNHFAFDGGFGGVMQSLKSAYELLNKQNFADSAVLLHNTLNGIETIDTRHHAAVSMCCLFLNSKDEDRRYIDDTVIEKKVKDFETEGIPMDFFLQLAKSLTIGYLENLKQNSNIS